MDIPKNRNIAKLLLQISQILSYISCNLCAPIYLSSCRQANCVDPFVCGSAVLVWEAIHQPTPAHPEVFPVEVPAYSKPLQPCHAPRFRHTSISFQRRDGARNRNLYSTLFKNLVDGVDSLLLLLKRGRFIFPMCP
jgi:hypothetical protein